MSLTTGSPVFPAASMPARTHVLGALALAIAGLLASAPAEAARVKVAGVTASSSYPASDVSYDAKLVADGKAGTSWVEGDEGSGLGSWIELDLGGEHTVSRIQVWAGMWYSSEYWARGNRPKAIEVKFSDGSTQDMTLTDAQEVQTLTLPSAKATSTLRFKVKSTYSGSTWQDTAISEIQVFDNAPDTAKPVRGYTSSSELPADGDGNYGAMNVGDGLADTMWCEGSKDGDGAGEWLQFDFGSSVTISKFSLIDGIGSLSMWMKANRATRATLVFSDGSSAAVDIKASMMPQTVSFPSKSTSSVKVTFDGIVKGKEFNDLCISEAYFE